MEWFSTVQAWLKQADWLANAIGIGGALLALAFLIQRNARPLFGASSFLDLADNTISPRWIADAAKEISEIAIVDDNPADFPIAELKKAGYKVRVYKEVSLNDTRRIAKYDVVFLDIHGIVKDDIESGGLKVIAQLRELNPHQKICAVSQKTFDPTASSFFKKADDVQKKPMNAQKCGELIDTLAREKLNPSRLASILDAATPTLSRWGRKKLILAMERFAKGDAPAEECKELQQALEGSDESSKVAGTDFIRVLRHVA